MTSSRIEQYKELTYDLAVFGENPLLLPSFEQSIPHRFHGIDKFAATALVRARHITSPVARKIIGRNYTSSSEGKRLAGIGYHSVVVSDGSGVVTKYQHRTSGMSDEEKVERVASLERDQALLLDTLGDFCEPQSFGISSFPPDPTKTVVSSRQREMNPTGSLDLQRPSAPLHQLLVRSADMLRRHGFMPDIVGKDNIIPNGNQITIIDTLPLFRDRPDNRPTLVRAAIALKQVGIAVEL